MSSLIKGGTIVTASDTYQADVLIQGEQIVAIGQGLAGDTTIDASGKYVIPGGIDVHTHLDMPFGGTVSSDDFFTGHQAAAFGGTTMHPRARRYARRSTSGRPRPRARRRSTMASTWRSPICPTA